jgi:class 3 adenylate cyclase
MAARLEGQSAGGDIVLSTETHADPAVQELLSAFVLRRETTELKGFDHPVPFLRLTAEALQRVGR